MSAPTQTITDLNETFIHSADDCKKLFNDVGRPTKIKLVNLWNKLRENTANIPNPTCIGGQFELAICITNGSEWFCAELRRVNQERLVVAEATRATDNAARAAANPAQAPDTSIINYTLATEADIEPYPKLTNPGRFVIDANKTAEEITIAKIKHDMNLKEFASYTVVDSAVQYFLRKVFGTDIFADMLTSDNFVLNKYSALQMRQHLDTKYQKLNPNDIKDELITFEKPPNTDAPLGLYFAKQNNCISVLADTDEPITEPKRLRTLLGHLQAIPSMQPAVDDYHKLVRSEGPKSWDDTRKFFIKEDLTILDNFQALSKAGIGSAHNVVNDERIDQLQVNAQELMNKNATYERALTDMAHVVNTMQMNQSTAAPTEAANSAPPTEMQTILNAITNLN